MTTLLLVLQGMVTGAVGPGISVMYATYGELITERSGRINLGVEGSMLMGAAFGVIATVESGSLLLGIVAGTAAGAALSLIYGYLVVVRGTNQLATGFSLTIFAGGITSWAGRAYVGQNVDGLDPIAIPLLSQIPLVGDALFNQDPLAYLAYALGPVLWYLLFRTRWGLSLRAVGESMDVAYAAARNPVAVQIMAVAVGGALAGLGGVQLSLAFTQGWSEGMTAGRGFIAVGLVIFALWTPMRAMVGALLFGAAIGLEIQLQTLSVPISPFILQMFPFVLTLAVLGIWTGPALRAVPEGLKGVLKGGR
jgi:general nucleoside transport system permease protein